MTAHPRPGSVLHPTRALPQASGAVTGGPNTILRLEGAIVLGAASIAYAHIGHGWVFFAALFLVPDLSMLGYLVNRKIGANVYNAGHSYIFPAMTGAFGVFQSQPIADAVALIWIAHIGFDRLLGYGLKYDTAFTHTHLGQPMGGKAAR